MELAPHASAGGSVPLAGCRITSPDGEPLRALRCLADAFTPGSGGAAVALSAADVVEIAVDPGHLAFGAVTGLIPERRFAVDPLTREIDLPDDVEGVALATAALVLDVSSSAEVPATIDLTLSGTSAGGSTMTMAATVALPPAAGGETRSEIVLDQTNSEIVPFLNNLPTTVTLSGEVAVGGDNVVGTLRPGDRARVGWRLEAPLSVIIEPTSITADPQPLELGDEARRQLSDHLGAARVRTRIVNHLPFPVQIRLLAGDDIGTVTTSPALVVGPLGAPGGALDPDLHVVSAATPHQEELALRADQTAILTRPGLVTVVELLLPGTAGEPVTLSAADFLEVTGAVLLDVEVGR
jgi:hypothetical protein